MLEWHLIIIPGIYPLFKTEFAAVLSVERSFRRPTVGGLFWFARSNS